MEGIEAVTMFWAIFTITFCIVIGLAVDGFISTRIHFFRGIAFGVILGAIVGLVDIAITYTRPLWMVIVMLVIGVVALALIARKINKGG